MSEHISTRERRERRGECVHDVPRFKLQLCLRLVRFLPTRRQHVLDETVSRYDFPTYVPDFFYKLTRIVSILSQSVWSFSPEIRVDKVDDQLATLLQLPPRVFFSIGLRSRAVHVSKGYKLLQSAVASARARGRSS